MSCQPEALYEAIQNADLTLLRDVVAKGFTPEADRPENGTTALHMAASYGNPKVLEFLLENGWSKFLNEFDEFSRTPLICAAISEHIDAVHILIGADSNINANDGSHIGNTVLREVAGNGSYNLIECLLKSGADPDIPGWMQLTARDKMKERLMLNPSEENQRIMQMMKS